MTPIKFLALSSVAAMGLVATGAQAQAAPSSSANSTAKAKVLKPMTIVKTNDLNFGTVVVNGAGSVSVPADVAGVAACGTNLVCQTGTSSSATFTVSGTKNENFIVTMPTTVSMTGPGAAIPVALVNNTTANKAVLSSTGSYALNVGGSFSVPADQVGGDYTGSYTVAVSYF